MTSAATVLAILRLWSPPAPYDEPPETAAEYEIRLETISEAVVAAGSERSSLWTWGSRVAVAGIMTIWRAESRLDPYVHAGRVHPDPRRHQDHGLATCLGSIHPSGLVPEWSTLAGTSLEATTRCARATLRVLRSSMWMCHHNVEPGNVRGLMEQALSHYGNGHSCVPCRESQRRASEWMRLVRKLGAHP